MVARELVHRRLRLATRVTKRAALWCRAWLVGPTNSDWTTRALLVLGLMCAQGCTQSLTAIESGNTGGAGSAECINKGCNFSDPANPQCCEGARCNTWGYCVAVDGGTNTNSGGGSSVQPGQACTGEDSCVLGFRCQSIGNYKICVSNTSTAVESLDGWHCQSSSDCSSLYCDNNSSCAVGTPCKTRGDPCVADKDCCSDRCTDDTCASSGQRSVYGDSCYSNEDCWTQPSGMNSCVWLGVTAGYRCLASTCRHESDVCTTSNQCCRGQCNFNRCQTGTAACLTYGLSCSGGDECCSGMCSRGIGYQWSCQKLDGCQPGGESCSDDSVCCSKTCTDGNCTATGGTSTCLNEGEPCLVGQCCGQLSCLWDWFSTVYRCSSLAPGSCRVTGDACAYESQCCNGARCDQNSIGDFKCGNQK